MDPRLVGRSRFLSRVLRHDPASIGLSLDANGWARIAELVRLARAAGVELDEERVRAIVSTNDKRRFSISDDGLSIRAVQGHSIAVDLGLEPAAPPETLYHGTALRFLASIRERGLVSARRRHVHLSADADTAIAVGRRHGAPVVLAVRAGEMHRAGHAFFRAQNGVWLVDAVPSSQLEFPPEKAKS